MPSIEEVSADSSGGPSTNTLEASSPMTTPIVSMPLEIEEIKPNRYSSMSTMKEPLDETNWTTWSKRIQSVFEVCQVEEYVQGTIKRPDPRINARIAKIWKNNDRFTKH